MTTPPPDSNERRVFEIKVLILGVFVFFVLTKLGYWLRIDFFGDKAGAWSYVYTEWLIDYSVGFVRRGLSGELISLLSPLVPARIVIASLTWSAFGILIFAYMRLIGRSLDKLTPLLLVGLLFLPSLLPFYIISLAKSSPFTSFMTLPWTFSEAAFEVTSFPVTILLSWILTSLIFGFCTLYVGSIVIDALWRSSATRSFDPTALAPPMPGCSI